jgi:hypothetical protein
MKKLLLTIGSIIFAVNVFAQDAIQTPAQETPKSADTKFLMTGFGFAGFTLMDKENSNFGPAGLNPIFLWKQSEHIFFESELAIALADGTVKFDLEYATLHYKLCNYLEVAAGKFLSPFGIFNERVHPSWVNKLADNPLGFNHDAGAMVGPMAEIGAEVSGGAQTGQGKINYAAYVTNGPSLIADPENPMMSGMLMYENVSDNNDNKAIGGRIGYLPFPNSSVEIGISGQVAKPGDNNSIYKDINAQMGAVDVSFIHKLDFIKSNLDIKAQFNMVNVDKAVKYPVDTTMMGADSTFDNKSQAYFFQAGIRPAFVENKFLRNVELAARYSSLTLPEKAMWGGDYNQITIGVNYWMSWHSVLKLDYQVNNRKGMDSRTGFLVQWAMGF